MPQSDVKKIDVSDPLRLKAMKTVVDRIGALAKDAAAEPGSGRFVMLSEQLDNSYLDVLDRYNLLKDRYSLLKRSNAALCDELSWLRDQLDDLSSKE